MPKQTVRDAITRVLSPTGSFAAMLGAAMLLSPHALAQTDGYPPQRQDPSVSTGSMRDPNAPGSTPESMLPEFRRETMLRREAARKVERKKRMVDSANRLLELTQQLRAELATREATPDDAKRLDEIAKLARVVRDQMRE